MKLYELITEMLELRHAFYNEDDDAALERIKEKFLARDIELDKKLDSCAKFIAELDGNASTIDDEIERLKRKRDVLQSRRDWLYGYVANCLGEGNKRKTALHTFGWRKSVAVELLNGAEVPAPYIRERVIREPDKKQIGDDLKAGASLDFARLVERQHLQIK